MKERKPRKGYLYTWNFFEGFLGTPKRKIRFKRVKPTLLWVAYLGGGPGWDNRGTPSGSVLCVLLKATVRAQSTENYHKFFDNYDVEGLKRAFPTCKVWEIDGGDFAAWEVEIPCQGWSEEKIDETIEAILEWHYQEVERIKRL